LLKDSRRERPSSPEVGLKLAKAHNQIAKVWKIIGEPDNAEKALASAFQELAALPRSRAGLEKSQLLLAMCHNDLAELLRERGDARDALIEGHYRAALTGLQAIVIDHPQSTEAQRELVRAYNDYGIFLENRPGRLDDALANYRKSLAQSR